MLRQIDLIEIWRLSAKWLTGKSYLMSLPFLRLGRNPQPWVASTRSLNSIESTANFCTGATGYPKLCTRLSLLVSIAPLQLAE